VETIMKATLPPETFQWPAILLAGDVDYDLYQRFRTQLVAAPREGIVVTELSTLGGDPEVARMMGEDIRFHSDTNPDCRYVFLGKATVYSAGATFMSFFARENRYLTRGTRLMIHERKMDKSLHVVGPLTNCVASVKALLHELEHSIRIQNEGFDALAVGSSLTGDDLKARAPENWYLEAQEAKDLGLIEGVI
jgi:ATP-dependent protease ClpP protease subunit